MPTVGDLGKVVLAEALDLFADLLPAEGFVEEPRAIGLEHPQVQPEDSAAHEVAREVPAAATLVEAYLAARWGGARLSAERARALLRGLDQGLTKTAVRGQTGPARPPAEA